MCSRSATCRLTAAVGTVYWDCSCARCRSEFAPRRAGSAPAAAAIPAAKCSAAAVGFAEEAEKKVKEENEKVEKQAKEAKAKAAKAAREAAGLPEPDPEAEPVSGPSRRVFWIHLSA